MLRLFWTLFSLSPCKGHGVIHDVKHELGFYHAHWTHASVETGDVLLRDNSRAVQLKIGGFLETSSSVMEQMEG